MMMILSDDDPILRTVSAPVEVFGESLRELADGMVRAMFNRDGLGLASVQIGRPVRLIIVRDDEKVIAMVNPVITRRLRRDDVQQEGCLSVPPLKWRRIARPAKCEVSWQDLDGAQHQGGFSGITARVIQHECDHLDGILITDYQPAA